MQAEDIHAELEELASLVSSAAFKEKQEQFFARFCGEFVHDVDESTANKLSYTTIHNDYIALIEADIVQHLGQPTLELIMRNVEAYVAANGAHARADQSEGIAQALDLLASMADFEQFKQAMLLKKDELRGGGALGWQGGAVLNMDDEFDKCADLVAASGEGGWRTLFEASDLSAWVKDGGAGKRFVRCSLQLDLPPHLAIHMMGMMGPEALEWVDRLAFINVVSDLGPDDRIIEVGMKLPWVVKYMMSFPDALCCRCIFRRDFPRPGDVTYLVVPFDKERHVAVEEAGPMKVKSGVLVPHPSGDPNLSVLYTLDMMSTSIPEWGLSMLLKSMVKGEMKKRATKFRASSYYANLLTQ